LPPERYCSLTFMKQILAGKKKYFQNFEIQPVTVPRYAAITMSLVLSKVKAKSRILEYLPDASELREKTVQRNYLFTLINTLDAAYFPNLIDEVEKLRESGGAKQEFVEVDAKILKLVESVYARARTAGGKRALGILKASAIKRKAPSPRKSRLTNFKT